MSPRQSILALILACVVPLLAAAAEGRLASNIVHSRALEDNLLGEAADHNIIIYLPPSYNSAPLKRYPVVYLLHGNLGHNTVWTEGAYQGLNIKSAMDELIAAGKVREMILVMPDVYNRYLGSHYANSVLTGRWADFISVELVSYIDGAFRTISSPRGRGLVGHSMGGRGALYLALKYPGVYSAIYALSAGRMAFEQFAPFSNETWVQVLGLKDLGTIDKKLVIPMAFAATFSPNPNRPLLMVDFPFELVQGELKRVEPVWKKWLAHDPVALLTSHQTNLRQLGALRFDCGAQDDVLGANRLFAQLLTSAGIPHQFEEYDGNHTNRLRQRLETKVLPFFSEMLNVD